MAPTPGTVLGDRFEVLGTLGRGGMAVVLLAHDRLRDERVALKVLHGHLADDPSMRRRLAREVQAAARLRAEPAALVGYDLHDLGDTLAISMPHHPGATLAEHVALQGPLDAAGLRTLGARIGRALDAAHRGGLLHRDVTPNNVILSRADDAVLTDFGIARLRDATATGTAVLGTPGFVAPEVCRGRRADPRVDLYGLGGVLYLAATGRAPFAGPSPAAVLAAQLSGAHAPLGELRPDLPADLVATIEALLAVEPGARPQSALEVVELLQSGTGPAGLEAPQRLEAAAPAVPEGLALPAGDLVLVVKGSRHADPDSLVRGVEQVAGLAPGTLPIHGSLRSKRARVRLVSGVDRGTAARLEQVAEVAGYRTSQYDVSPPSTLNQVAEFFWIPIALVWTAFPFLVTNGMNPTLLIPVFVAISVVLPVVGGWLTKQKVPRDLPLALANRVRVASTGAPEGRSLAERPPPSALDDPDLGGRAAGAVRALLAALEERHDLPDAALVDLRRTATDLAARAEETRTSLRRVTEALAQDPAPEATWLEGRAERLRTRVRTGDDTAAEELSQLELALTRHREAEAARDALESQETVLQARLLEIAAGARRTHQALLLGPSAHSGDLLVERLEREVRAAAAARREAGRARRPEPG